jgi:hypothetical protein
VCQGSASYCGTKLQAQVSSKSISASQKPRANSINRFAAHTLITAQECRTKP